MNHPVPGKACKAAYCGMPLCASGLTPPIRGLDGVWNLREVLRASGAVERDAFERILAGGGSCDNVIARRLHDAIMHE